VKRALSYTEAKSRAARPLWQRVPADEAAGVTRSQGTSARVPPLPSPSSSNAPLSGRLATGKHGSVVNVPVAGGGTRTADRGGGLRRAKWCGRPSGTATESVLEAVPEGGWHRGERRAKRGCAHGAIRRRERGAYRDGGGEGVSGGRRGGRGCGGAAARGAEAGGRAGGGGGVTVSSTPHRRAGSRGRKGAFAWRPAGEGESSCGDDGGLVTEGRSNICDTARTQKL